ncbi:MAG TPA: hypothetical protein VIH64_06030, partial [Streptosporangiaceae bacterium]
MGDHTTSSRPQHLGRRRWLPIAVAAVIVAACVGFGAGWYTRPARTAAATGPASTTATAVPVTATIKVTCQDSSSDAARI